MSSTKRREITEKDVVGLKYFSKLTPLLTRLHQCGCVRDKAGNRTLHFDQYGSLVLLFLFNPIVQSLRSIQQASELKKVQKKLGCARASLGSLSESVHVFDPSLLEGIIAELGQQLQPLTADPKLKDVRQIVKRVDGTLLKALPRITEAALLGIRTNRRCAEVYRCWASNPGSQGRLIGAILSLNRFIVSFHFMYLISFHRNRREMK